AFAHNSPRLFAVYHVLHRHLTPRHSPCALRSFSRLLRRPRSSRRQAVCLPCSFRCPSGARPAAPTTVSSFVRVSPPVQRPRPLPRSAPLSWLPTRLPFFLCSC